MSPTLCSLLVSVGLFWIISGIFTTAHFKYFSSSLPLILQIVLWPLNIWLVQKNLGIEDKLVFEQQLASVGYYVTLSLLPVIVTLFLHILNIIYD